MFAHFKQQFSEEESNSVMSHKKPLLEGETGRSLSDALHAIREITRRAHIPEEDVLSSIESFKDARQLRMLAEIIGDQPDR
jgi:hypothetical protein